MHVSLWRPAYSLYRGCGSAYRLQSSKVYKEGVMTKAEIIKEIKKLEALQEKMTQEELFYGVNGFSQIDRLYLLLGRATFEEETKIGSQHE